MRIRSIHPFLTAAILGCAGRAEVQVQGDPIVATVGPRIVTRSYYEDRLRLMDRVFVPDTLDLAGKRRFLDLLIDKDVMALKAAQLGYADAPDVKAAVAKLEEDLVCRRALELAVQDKLAVSDEEVRRSAERARREVLAQHILLASRDEAEAVLAALRAGASFDSMVAAHSIVTSIASDGSELTTAQRADYGWQRQGDLSPPAEDAIFDTPLFEVSEPIESLYGWHLFRPVATRDADPGAAGANLDEIRKQLVSNKRQADTNDYNDEILRDRGFSIDLDACNIAYGRLPPDPTDRTDPGTETKPVIPFTDRELTIPLFVLDGRTFTLADFSNEYDRRMRTDRPQKWIGPSVIYSWIRDVWLKPLKLERARRDGIDKLPDVVAEMDRLRELIMVGYMHDRTIGDHLPTPTEAEIDSFYRSHARGYVEPEQRICNLFIDADPDEVRRAYAEIKAGADFVATVIRYEETATQPEHVQTAPFSRQDSAYREMAGRAFALGLHEYSEPFETSQGWVILQVQQIFPETPLALEDIYERVASDWKKSWGEKRLRELLGSWRREFPITVDDAVLASVKVTRNDVFVP